MNQSQILAELNRYTQVECESFSALSGSNGERFAVIKFSGGGSGKTQPLQTTFNALVAQSSVGQQGVYDGFNSPSQVMGGRPCKGE